MAKPQKQKPSPDDGEGEQQEGRRQTMEEAADAIDDTTVEAPPWRSVRELVDAIDNHVLRSHGLTSDKEFLQKIADFIRPQAGKLAGRL